MGWRGMSAWPGAVAALLLWTSASGLQWSTAGRVPAVRSAVASPEVATQPKSTASAWFEACLGAASRTAVGLAPEIEAMRASGREVLERVGPSRTRSEPWRYSADLRSVWAAAPGIETAEARAEAVAVAARVVPEDTTVLVVVDGVLEPSMSSATVDEDWFAGPAGDAPEWASYDLGGVPEAERELERPNDAIGSAAWAALNAACATEALVVAARGREERQAHVVHVSTGKKTSHPRLAVSVTGEARLVLHQTFYSLASMASEADAKNHPEMASVEAVCNSRTTATVDENASLQHVYAVASPGIHQHESCELRVEGRYAGTAVVASRARLGFNVAIDKPEAEANLDGLALSDGDPVDLYTALAHLVPDAVSSQDVRLVAAGQGALIFKGRIDVPVQAQRTDAQQLCRASVLSDRASALVMPCLDIVADDVKCAHGATVADLDDDAFFFLLCRGIPPQKAKALLVHGFCDDLLAGLNGPAKLPAQLAAIIDSKIGSIVANDNA